MSDPDAPDWESYLPVVQMCYNSAVRKATKQSPFFLTYLHDPNLPHFDLDNRRPLYGESWAVTAYQRMQFAHRLAQENIVRAAEKIARGKTIVDTKSSNQAV